MRITVDGKLGKGVTAKDVALYMMSKMTTSEMFIRDRWYPE